MLLPCHFGANIVDVFVQRFRGSPNSLADAFGVIWSIDAYATHAALHLDEKEGCFKDKLAQDGCWQFRLLREASNATKHAVLRHEKRRDVSRSDSVNLSDRIVGYTAYFSGAQHYGTQICIEVAWTLDEPLKIWYDGRGKIIEGGGPFINIVPILDLVEPALTSIEKHIS